MDLSRFTPDLTRDAVFRPCSREPFEFFTECGSVDFCMENIYLTAWWAANLCHLSYCNKNKLIASLDGKGRLLKIFEVQSQMAYVVEIGDSIFLVFQGSCSPEDTMLDLDFFPCKENSISMHRGFNKACNFLWPQIEDFFKGQDMQKVILTGHSLGGAIAYIASTRMRFSALYTFGAPRVVFNSTKGVNQDNIYRFVNCTDAVPTLPPAVFGYKHVGEMIFIDEFQNIHRNIGTKSIINKIVSSSRYIAEGRWVSKQNAPARSLMDHAPVNYSRALSRHLLS